MTTSGQTSQILRRTADQFPGPDRVGLRTFEYRPGNCHGLPTQPSMAIAGVRSDRRGHWRRGIVRSDDIERGGVRYLLATRPGDIDNNRIGAGIGRECPDLADDLADDSETDWHDIDRSGRSSNDDDPAQTQVQPAGRPVAAGGHLGLEWTDDRSQRDARWLDDPARQRRSGSVRLPSPAAGDGRTHAHRTRRVHGPVRPERHRATRCVPRRADRTSST